jgi:plasmid maintenance system antidote protein VapI
MVIDQVLFLWMKKCKILLRLSKALGRSPESWLTMQDGYDLWHARQSVNLDNVEKIEFKAA